MPTLRLRITTSEDGVRELMHALESIEGIEHVEEVADLMPHMDDDDSSSAGLSDLLGPTAHEIEIETPNEEGSRRVRAVAEALSQQLEAVVEFIDVV